MITSLLQCKTIIMYLYICICFFVILLQKYKYVDLSFPLCRKSKQTIKVFSILSTIENIIMIVVVIVLVLLLFAFVQCCYYCRCAVFIFVLNQNFTFALYCQRQLLSFISNYLNFPYLHLLNFFTI